MGWAVGAGTRVGKPGPRGTGDPGSGAGSMEAPSDLLPQGGWGGVEGEGAEMHAHPLVHI